MPTTFHLRVWTRFNVRPDDVSEPKTDAAALRAEFRPWLTFGHALYARFDHQHLFEPTPDGTLYTDQVIFVPGVPAQKLVALLTRRMFVHRHRVAARRLPHDPRVVGVSALRVAIEEGAPGTADDPSRTTA